MPGFCISTTDNCNERSQYFGASNLAETARRHRYSLEILEPLNNGTGNILSYLKKCTRPVFEYEKIPIYNSGDVIHRPGIRKWKPVVMTFYETIHVSQSQNFPTGNVTAKLIYDWRSKTMADVNTGIFQKPSAYMKTCVLAMLDGDGNTIWKYSLYDCWPSSTDPCDLSYTESEISEISMTLQYSRAIEE